MAQPEANVRPRVYLDNSAVAVTLDRALDLPRDVLKRPVLVVGGAGAGKSTALAYMAQRLAPGATVIDDPRPGQIRSALAAGPFATSASKPDFAPRELLRLTLAAWGDDELIEYLLSAHRDRCASVMQRVLGMRDRDRLDGNPELWAAALEELAVDDSLADIDSVLHAIFARVAPKEHERRIVERLAFGATVELPWDGPTPAQPVAAAWRYARHRALRLIAAARHAAGLLSAGEGDHLSRGNWPEVLIRACAAGLADNEVALATLCAALDGPARWRHPVAASILHVSGLPWRPDRHGSPKLVGAILTGARWPKLRLPNLEAGRAYLERALLDEAELECADMHSARMQAASLCRARLRRASLDAANLSGADLSSADLWGATLHGTALDRANLQRSCLRGAVLVESNLNDASFRGADLSRVLIRRSSMDGTNLAGASLRAAHLLGLDLRSVRLDGAVFRRARLIRCDLTECRLRRADFRSALLEDCDLSGTSMPWATLARAKVQRCGLADIDWSGADLRKADLTGSTFHMGSSRSGLVFSPIASEGSRTGFYTDDLADLTHRAPEEVRKANLTDADLRGAMVEGVDFYLVDLRGAKYTAEQAEWFTRCGAILRDEP